MFKEINLYTDGGARGNPGPAGAGIWIETLQKKYSQFLGENKTNNEAEYEALILGLKKIKSLLGKKQAKETKVKCFLDSELVVKQLNHQYKLKEKRIQQYFLEIWNLGLDFKQLIFQHIPREKNKIADQLVNQALDKEKSKLF